MDITETMAQEIFRDVLSVELGKFPRVSGGNVRTRPSKRRACRARSCSASRIASTAAMLRRL